MYLCYELKISFKDLFDKFLNERKLSSFKRITSNFKNHAEKITEERELIKKDILYLLPPGEFEYIIYMVNKRIR